jgi:hypothetical protein
MTYVIPWTTPIDDGAAHALAADLCVYACDGSRGRPEKGDPVYDAVTEHRDTGKEYSSCADLAHWMLFRLGVRELFINRVEHRGFKRQVNLSRLAWCVYATAPSAADRFEPGDILVIWARPDTKDAHVTVVLEDRRAKGVEEIQTANYGAPGGKISTSATSHTKLLGQPAVKLGDRAIRRWLPLCSMLRRLRAADALMPAEDPMRTEDGSLIWSPDHA